MRPLQPRPTDAAGDERHLLNGALRCSAFATSVPGATGNTAAGTGSAAGVVQTAARNNAAVAATAINRHDEPHDTDSVTARERERAPKCRRPPDTGLSGPWRLVVGNHAPTRIPGREEQTGTDSASMTLVIRSAPPLLVTHGPTLNSQACDETGGRPQARDTTPGTKPT